MKFMNVKLYVNEINNKQTNHINVKIQQYIGTLYNITIIYGLFTLKYCWKPLI